MRLSISSADDPAKYALTLDPIPADSAAITVTITQTAGWPEGPCVQIVSRRFIGERLIDEDNDIYSGGKWKRPNGTTTNQCSARSQHPGGCVKDEETGKTVCIVGDGRLFVSEAEAALLTKTNMTDAEIKNSKQKLATVRRVEVLTRAELEVEVLQPVDAEITLEAT